MPPPLHRSIPLNLLLFAITFFATGCATVFAPKAGNQIDIQRIQPGMERSAVEDLLGAPTLDIKPEFAARADRKCEYVYFQRDAIDSDPSTYQRIRNRMVGFTDHRIVVYYDRANRVIRIERPMTRNTAIRGIYLPGLKQQWVE